MFNIGDAVYTASANWCPKQIVCPDCCGKKFLTVILGDDSHVTVDCRGCEKGYLGPSGTINSYDYHPHVEAHVVTGVRKTGEGFEYTFGHQRSDGENAFVTLREAEERAETLARNSKIAEEKRLLTKEKDHESWAWNANYHRGCIRRAEKEIAYHRSKLEVALQHKKET